MDYCCQTPVLLIFFNRPDTFAQVFEKVRRARPRTLILAQDGPRNAQDQTGIDACRRIAESVDWECNITRLYSEVNLGCGVRPQSAITYALEQHEQVIILEDDCVPADSFFPYCEELLARYANDDRIAYISGLNHFETWDCGEYDYFFSRAAAIWGWATWRRAWCRFYDYSAQGIHDPYLRKLYRQQIGSSAIYERRVESLMKANEAVTTGEKLSYWDTQWGFAQFTQNILAIVPRVNLISNIGIGANSTHAKDLTRSKYIKYKNFVYIPTHKLEFPLKHPNFCACDMDYHNLIYRCIRGSWVRRILSKIKWAVLSRSK